MVWGRPSLASYWDCWVAVNYFTDHGSLTYYNRWVNNLDSECFNFCNYINRFSSIFFLQNKIKGHLHSVLNVLLLHKTIWKLNNTLKLNNSCFPGILDKICTIHDFHQPLFSTGRTKAGYHGLYCIKRFEKSLKWEHTKKLTFYIQPIFLTVLHPLISQLLDDKWLGNLRMCQVHYCTDGTEVGQSKQTAFGIYPT